MPASWSGQVAIVGAYESPRRRAPGLHPFMIQAECARGALSDAGLEPADVDGFATAASFPAEGAREMAVAEVAEYLGLHPRWIDGTDIGGAAPISHAGHAVAAIAAGLAEVVLVTYAACGYSWPYGAPDYLTYSHGPGQWELPYGPSTVATYALGFPPITPAGAARWPWWRPSASCGAPHRASAWTARELRSCTAWADLCPPRRP